MQDETVKFVELVNKILLCRSARNCS